ncbi:MAG: DoxX family protein [Flavobacterium sp.]
MKISASLKDTIVFIISLLYILLFVYAAVSKILDFENFQIQLGQSPMLSAYAGIISWMVPAFEIAISLALLYQRVRFFALLGAFILMIMFTTYIIIILNFSSFVPCSCGGVLEKMGWKEHLIFNIGFVLLALIGLIIERKKLVENTSAKIRKLLTHRFFTFTVLASFIISIGLVTALYLFSEEEIHRNNSFLRRYPPHPVTTIKGINIKYNSYYIAGFDKGRIYLGNTSAPSHIFSIDTTLNNIKTKQLKLDNKENIIFYAPQLKIHPPYFFLIDGNVPVIFKGNLSDWNAKLYWQGNDKFSQAEVISPNEFIVSGLDRHGGQNAISYIDLNKSKPVIQLEHLLEKQSDGIFDTDGMLRYNTELGKSLYIYYYRNEFLLINSDMQIDYKGRTIDTIKQASIKLAYKDSGRVRTLAERPLVVQKQSAAFGKYLFTKSERLGQYEPEEMLKDASIIDVYNLENHIYEFSFYLYDYEGEKIKSFAVYNNILVGLSDHYLVLYRLQPLNFDL